MNDHDIRLTEIGQKEGYDRAVKEIVAWLEDYEPLLGDKIEAKFGGRDGQ